MHSAPPIDSVAHLTFPVGDLARAEAFYVGLLGAEVVRRFDRDTLLRLHPERAAQIEADSSWQHLAVRLGDSPELHLFLSPGLERRKPQPHPHLALWVDHDHLDRFTARLLAAGVKIDGPRRLGGPGQASVYFTDPWGQLLELSTNGYDGETRDGPPDMATLA